MNNIQSISVTPPVKKRRVDSIGTKSKRFFGDPYIKNGDKTKIFYKCKICGLEKNGTHDYNLGTHLRLLHQKEYNEINDNFKDSLAVKRIKLLQNATEIVSVNGKPFKFILASGYQAGIRNKIDKLNKAGFKIDLSNEHLNDLKNHLRQMANSVRAKIIAEVRGKTVCLLLDLVTKNGRSVQGISVQYISNKETYTRSLGIIELKESHTGKYLSKITADRLNEFGIHVSQIPTITKDNAANLNKMIREMDDSIKSSMGEKQVELNEVDEMDGQIDVDIAQMLAGTEDISDDDALCDLFEEAILTKNANILNEMSLELSSYGIDIQWDITAVNCAPHTLQLGILDTLKQLPKEHRNLIALARHAVKILRLPKTKDILQAAGISYKKPRIDVVTRWGSMYQMVINFHYSCLYNE